MDETAYTQGSQQAWLSMLRLCLRQLGADSLEATAPRWVVERTEAVLTLRTVCAEFGDNDWSDDLHLSDVIEKHLSRHLESSSRE